MFLASNHLGGDPSGNERCIDRERVQKVNTYQKAEPNVSILFLGFLLGESAVRSHAKPKSTVSEDMAHNGSERDVADLISPLLSRSSSRWDSLNLDEQCARVEQWNIDRPLTEQHKLPFRASIEVLARYGGRCNSHGWSIRSSNHHHIREHL